MAAQGMKPERIGFDRALFSCDPIQPPRPRRGQPPLISRHSPLATRHSPLVTRHSSLATHATHDPGPAGSGHAPTLPRWRLRTPTTEFPKNVREPIAPSGPLFIDVTEPGDSFTLFQRVSPGRRRRTVVHCLVARGVPRHRHPACLPDGQRTQCTRAVRGRSAERSGSPTFLQEEKWVAPFAFGCKWLVIGSGGPIRKDISNELPDALQRWYYEMWVRRSNSARLTTTEPTSGRLRSVKGEYAPRINETWYVE